VSLFRAAGLGNTLVKGNHYVAVTYAEEVLNDVASWLTKRSQAWREDIQAMSIDPHAGYLKGILAMLCDMTLTVDNFHASRLANGMVDDVYRAIQQESLGQRGRKIDPLYATRGLMTRG
jgi:transposase